MKLPGGATRAWLADFLRRLFSALRQRTFWAATAGGNQEAKKRRRSRGSRVGAEAVLLQPAPIATEEMPPLGTLAATDVALLPPAPLAAETEGLTPTGGALSPTSTIVLDGAPLSSEDPAPSDGFLRATNSIILHSAAAVPTAPASSVRATDGKLEDDGGFTLVVGRKRKRRNAQATLGPAAPPPALRHGPPRVWFQHHARSAPPPPSRRILPAAPVSPPATASGPVSSPAPSIPAGTASGPASRPAPSIPAATTSGPTSSPAPASSTPAATSSGSASSGASIISQELDDMEKERLVHLQFWGEMMKLKGNKIYCLICYLERDQALVPMQNKQADINRHNRSLHKGRLEKCTGKGCLLVATNRHDIGVHSSCCHPHVF